MTRNIRLVFDRWLCSLYSLVNAALLRFMFWRFIIIMLNIFVRSMRWILGGRAADTHGMRGSVCKYNGAPNAF